MKYAELALMIGSILLMLFLVIFAVSNFFLVRSIEEQIRTRDDLIYKDVSEAVDAAFSRYTIQHGEEI